MRSLGHNSSQHGLCADSERSCMSVCCNTTTSDMLQNPTLDVLESKLRQLQLHRHITLTWGQLAHVW